MYVPRDRVGIKTCKKICFFNNDNLPMKIGIIYWVIRQFTKVILSFALRAHNVKLCLSLQHVKEERPLHHNFK